MNFSITQKNSNENFIRTTLFFLFLCKIPSHHLWLADRTVPIVPLFDFLYSLPNFLHTFLYAASILTIIFCFVKPAKKWLLATVLFLELASCLLDQMRWQPWEYQYITLIFILLINKKDNAAALALIVLVSSSTYIYSGLQKFNPHYFTLTWKNIFVTGFFGVSENVANNIWVMRLGYVVPLSELTFGVLLLFNKTRKLAIICIVLMHSIISLIVGPSGVNENYTVLFWNFAMIVFMLQLWRVSINWADLYRFKKISFNYVAIVAWAFLPLLNLFGYWYFFLSSSLYSGRVDVCFIKVENPPPNFELRKYYKDKKADSNFVNIETIALQTWTNDELDTPPFPEEAVYRKVMQQWKKKYPNVQAKFYVIKRAKTKKQVVLLN